jgi:hypothetical protein
MMKEDLIQIIEKVREDISYHAQMVEHYPEDSMDWNFHLGWVDALTSYRWKLELLIKD